MKIDHETDFMRAWAIDSAAVERAAYRWDKNFDQFMRELILIINRARQ